jgi:hypothetical protein
MREQPDLGNPQSVAVRPLGPNSNPTRIKIHWVEAVAKSIELRHHDVEAATLDRFNDLKSSWQPGRASRLGWVAQDPMNFAAWQRRWGR